MSHPVHDHLIVGAGPAGLQLAAELQRDGRDYLVLEGGERPGGFFEVFPRHRKLISINKPHTGSTDPEFNLRMDWNSLLSDDPSLLFTRYSERYFPSADDLVRYLADFAETLGLNIRYGARVERVERDGALFQVTDGTGAVHRGRRLIMATGVSKPYVPDVPGIETAEYYTDVSVDPADFTDQRVLILGKANSALETADNLIETATVIHLAGPGSLRLAWQSHFVGHVRAVNNNFLDTYQLKSQNAILDGEAASVERRDDGYAVRFRFSRADDFIKEIHYDRVIVATGFRFDASVFADDCRPRLVIKDRFPEMTSAYESVNVPGLYFAGTLMQQRDFKKSTGGFIHGFRYAVRALGRILGERHHDTAWPGREVPAEPAALAAELLARLNRTSALWQQFGQLADLVATAGAGLRHYEEVPVDYAHDTGFADAENLFVITLEYGPDHDKIDPFDVTVRRVRQDDAEDAHDAAYLHPVVRHYRRGQFTAAHHVAENLENEWDRPAAHHEPLTAFLAKALADAPEAVR
ncbi:NAD(P)-binding domain-containing protein [Streptantibioticus silvisoli]|uniref:NAD(P)-binding domain-containing protein n=1 Tax=Streptantibioticus silvisoli TaxID=2705255 RepID=A0ABT6W4B5_9ACTN|nr:NAD(P)-binding domain-containing protein [Streptantibioticus silvisoli]MDI5965591.1 NAD(P)-binding domain-containing protein [Streptantibioticus silvisoli]